MRNLIEDGHVYFITLGLLSEPIKSTSFIIICVRGFVFKKDMKYEIRQRGRGGGAKGIHTFPFRNLSLNNMQLAQVAVFVATSSPKTSKHISPGVPAARYGGMATPQGKMLVSSG